MGKKKNYVLSGKLRLLHARDFSLLACSPALTSGGRESLSYFLLGNSTALRATDGHGLVSRGFKPVQLQDQEGRSTLRSMLSARWK